MSLNPTCLCCRSHSLTLWSRAKDTEYLSSEKSYDYFRCRDCSSLSIHPVPSDALNLIYPPNYYSYKKNNSGIVYQIKEWLDLFLFKKVLTALPGSSLNVLDVGGGRGWVLSKVKRADSRVHLTQVVEVSEEARVEAEAAGHRYFGSGIEKFKADDVRFDLVIMLSVIEHVEDPVSVLKCVRALLKPGGRILIQTPNYDSLDAKIFKNYFWGGYHCPRHWVIFNPKSFADVCRRSGLEIEEFKYTQGAIFWSWSVISLLSHFGLLRVTQERPATDHPLMPFLNVMFAVFEFLRLPFSKTSQVHAIVRVP